MFSRTSKASYRGCTESVAGIPKVVRGILGQEIAGGSEHSHTADLYCV